MQRPELEFRDQNCNTEVRTGIQRPEWKYRGQNGNTEARMEIQRLLDPGGDSDNQLMAAGSR